MVLLILKGMKNKADYNEYVAMAAQPVTKEEFACHLGRYLIARFEGVPVDSLVSKEVSTTAPQGCGSCGGGKVR